MTGLTPGTYELVVWLKDEPGALARIGELEIPASGPCTDERTRAIQLPELHEYEFIVLAPNGTPVNEGNVTMRPAGDARAFDDFPEPWFAGGYIRLFSTSASVDVRITADRFQPRELRRITSGKRVVLQPYLRAVADFGGELAPLPPELKWSPTIRWPGTGAENEDTAPRPYFWYKEGLIRERVSWHVPCAGRWEMSMGLSPQSPSRSIPDFETITPWRVEVLDTQAEQVFHLPEGHRDFPGAGARAVELLVADD